MVLSETRHGAGLTLLNHWAWVPSSKVTCTAPRIPRTNSVMAPPSVGSTLRAITRPLSSRTEATVVARWTSNATYLVVRFMRAAPCCGPRVLVDSMVTARGALSTCVRQRYHYASPAAVFARATTWGPCGSQALWARETGVHDPVHRPQVAPSQAGGRDGSGSVARQGAAPAEHPAVTGEKDHSALMGQAAGRGKPLPNKRLKLSARVD